MKNILITLRCRLIRQFIFIAFFDRTSILLKPRRNFNIVPFQPIQMGYGYVFYYQQQLDTTWLMEQYSF